MGITSVRLYEDIEGPLEDLAKRLDRSKNYIINQAVKEYVVRQAMEDARWADTLGALESIKAGKSAGEDEVASWLRSWGQEDEQAPPGK